MVLVYVQRKENTKRKKNLKILKVRSIYFKDLIKEICFFQLISENPQDSINSILID